MTQLPHLGGKNSKGPKTRQQQRPLTTRFGGLSLWARPLRPCILIGRAVARREGTVLSFLVLPPSEVMMLFWIRLDDLLNLETGHQNDYSAQFLEPRDPSNGLYQKARATCRHPARKSQSGSH